MLLLLFLYASIKRSSCPLPSIHLHISSFNNINFYKNIPAILIPLSITIPLSSIFLSSLQYVVCHSSIPLSSYFLSSSFLHYSVWYVILPYHYYPTFSLLPFFTIVCGMSYVHTTIILLSLFPVTLQCVVCPSYILLSIQLTLSYYTIVCGMSFVHTTIILLSHFLSSLSCVVCPSSIPLSILLSLSCYTMMCSMSLVHTTIHPTLSLSYYTIVCSMSYVHTTILPTLFPTLLSCVVCLPTILLFILLSLQYVLCPYYHLYYTILCMLLLY